MTIDGVLELIPTRHSDDRGFLAELCRSDEFRRQGIPKLVQINHSHSKANVVRGLHYQVPPRAAGKLVACIRGSIFDVVVDLRAGSKTFGQHLSAELTQSDGRMLYVPPGCAHGFAVTAECADVMYLQSEYYSPEHDRALLWNDPKLEIAWPVESPKLSAKDASAPGFHADLAITID